MTLRCFFRLHSWTLWSEPVERLFFAYNFGVKLGEMVRRRQARRCQDCRLVQHRYLMTYEFALTGKTRRLCGTEYGRNWRG